MKKVITYGTFDLIHYGHIRLLERAKALGDYLIVGVTSDDYDRSRGKINNRQSFMERVESVKATGIPDEVIVEEYDGQKVDDIKHFEIDVFAIGSDWKGKFDYLNQWCEVVYLERTSGISSSQLRTDDNQLNINIIGSNIARVKFENESTFVNGVNIVKNDENASYIISHPNNHYIDICSSLNSDKHVICKSPLATKVEDAERIFHLAKSMNKIIFDDIKTAYSIAYTRMLLLIKSEQIGQVISVDCTCTSLNSFTDDKNLESEWCSMYSWGPIALLPVFQILGTRYTKKQIITKYLDKSKKFDAFSRINFVYKNAVASIKVAKFAKSEGELIVTGTKGYIYVPAPWWKTDYFEVRYENAQNNKKFFYQLEGEGIRNEIVAFRKSILTNKNFSNVDEDVSLAIVKIIEDYDQKKDLVEI